ncbi:MAG: N-6 DNA methylase [Planctomycetes bacterium]|nr:N-6 DNA methylase [Planctomycetota bacterium]
MNRKPESSDQRAFRALLSRARAAIAADLAGRVSPEALPAAIQGEIIALLLEAAGHEAPGPGMISGDLHDKLAARLGKMEPPWDFLGAAHLNYLSSSIMLTDGKPRVVRNASRKSTGSYYTPRNIVERIVAGTLAAKLSECVDVREASRLRILDMACGSGVFIIEAGMTLVRFYLERGLPKSEAANIAAAQVIGADLSPDAIDVARMAFGVADLPEPKLFAADALLDDRFRWQEALPEIFADGGFDVIVGNPPYGAVARLDAATKRALANAYDAYAGHGDLHYCFFERGLKLLKPGGLLGLLSSAYFLQASHAQKLRALLSKQSQIQTIIDCSGEELFTDAMIHCVVTIVRKTPPAPAGTLRFDPPDGEPFDFPQEGLSGAPWVIISDSEQQWRAKLEKDSVPLGEFCDIVQGPESGLNKAFVVAADYAREARLEDELLRPLIKNSDIGRYAISHRDDLLIYVPRGTQIERHPAIMKHLENYRDKLEAREVCRNTSAPWFAFHRPRKASQMSAALKIVCPYRAPAGRFAVDGRRALNDGGDVRMIFPKPDARVDLYFLTAILNSRMMQRYFSRIGRRKGAMLEHFKDSLKILPIRMIPSDHPVYSTLADLARLQHDSFSEQRDYLTERIVLDLYELRASAAAPGMLF